MLINLWLHNLGYPSQWVYNLKCMCAVFYFIIFYAFFILNVSGEDKIKRRTHIMFPIKLDTLIDVVEEILEGENDADL